VYLEIHEVTIGVSLLEGTSPTTESILSLDPEINLEKYKHPCVDMGPSGFLIGANTGNGPWLGPPPDRRGVMTDDADSE
jgi:hypothetical protein